MDVCIAVCSKQRKGLGGHFKYLSGEFVMSVKSDCVDGFVRFKGYLLHLRLLIPDCIVR